MKKFFALLLSCLLLGGMLSAYALELPSDEWICVDCRIWVSGSSCPQCDKARPNVGAVEEQYLLNLDVSFEKNTMFSKHDVEVLVNGQKAFTMKHGVSLAGNVIVPAGKCEIVFRVTNDYAASQRVMLYMDKDATFSAKLSTHFYGVKLENPASSVNMEDMKILQGEAAICDGMRMTVLSVKESRGNSGSEPAEGYVFVMVEFEVINMGQKKVKINPADSFSAYCDGYTIEPSLRAASVAPMGFASELAGSAKIKGMLCFELPENWQALELIYGEESKPYESLHFVVYGQ